MAFILWLIAVALVIYGIITLVRGGVLMGIVLIVLGLLVGPGGVSISPDPPHGITPTSVERLDPSPLHRGGRFSRSSCTRRMTSPLGQGQTANGISVSLPNSGSTSAHTSSPSGCR